jgi:hypothetical protein
MPRKSAASLAVIPPSPRPYPEPLAHLSAPEAAIWRTIVKCRPPDFFDAANQVLLEQYCRHAHSANVIAKAIQAIPDPEADLRRYSKLLEMAARESKAIMALSSKLRLAVQYSVRNDKVLAKQHQWVSGRPQWEYVP